MTRTVALTMTLFLSLLMAAGAGAQDGTITYQGQLRQGGLPFTGTANMEFALFDDLLAGNSVGSPLTRLNWPVEDGLFQVDLDFGPAAFDGGDRYLEVRVDGAPLSPRQRVTATPYALLAAGAAAGSIDGVSVDPTEIQLRVVGTCPPDEYVTEVNQDGTVTCGSASGAGTVTQVDTGAGLAGGPITDTGTIFVAPGGIGATEIDSTQVQERIATACPAGEFVQAINEDGTPVCDTASAAAGTVTQVDTGAGLTGGPITESGTIAIAPGGVGATEIDATQVQRRVAATCPGEEFVVAINQDGSTVCASDPDFDGTVTQVDTGAGLTGGPITESGTVSIAPGGVGITEIDAAQVQRRVTGTCPIGSYVQVVTQEGNVACGADANSGGTVTQVDTGTGLIGGPITETGTIAIAPGGIGTTEIDSAQVQRRVAGTCPAGEYVQQVNQDGSVSCGVDAVGISGWSLSGNAGTNPATDFLGTTDATPLVLRADNAPALRIEPSSIISGSPALPITVNSIGGSHSNAVVAGVRGATIAGGGSPGGEDPDEPLTDRNYVTDHYGTVGGGTANQVGDNTGDLFDRAFATVAGGFLNVASGRQSTVGGGAANDATGTNSTVGGGITNRASGSDSTVGGGSNHLALANNSTVSGGDQNSATGIYSTVSGGRLNAATDSYATIAGGESNDATGVWTAIGGGVGNQARTRSATVAGGEFNYATGVSSTVVGGDDNTASHVGSSVGGGERNCAGGEYSWAGGRRAKARPGSGSGDPGNGCSIVSLSGDADGDNGTFVWADSQDVDFVSTGENQFLVRAAGGVGVNTNSPLAPLTVQGAGKWNPSIGNGYGDFLVGDATYGLAIGVADGPGAGAGAVRFWPVGGNEAIVFTTASSYPDRTLTLSDAGLVGVRRNPAVNALEVAGNASKTAAGDWLANSDRRIKTDIREIPDALDRLMQLRPVTFRYTDAYRGEHAELDEARYYNVIAQEFARVFPEAVKGSGEYLPGLPERPENEILQVDTHPAAITTIAAVQELAVRLERAEARNASLEAEVAHLREQQGRKLAELRAEVALMRELIAPRMAEHGAR